MNDTETTVPHKCASCASVLDHPAICQGCHTLNPLPKSVDHFEMLGLPRRYDLDESEVRSRYMAISRQIHPDVHGDAGFAMNLLATRISAEVNEALRVLKDPVLRAGYLLELCGGPSAADDRTVAPEVLSETMMLREEIEEAQAANDDAQLASLRATVNARQGALLGGIAERARRLPGEAGDAERTQLRHALNAVKYYRNMEELLLD